MSKNRDIAVVVPVDRVHRSYMIVRATHTMPWVPMRYKLKGVGGLVEKSDTSMWDAAKRELEEEFPGWLIKDPGSKVITITPVVVPWGEPHGNIAEGDTQTWHSFVIYTDLGAHSFRNACRVATESLPEIRYINDGPLKAEDTAVGFDQVIYTAVSESVGWHNGIINRP
jgi:8-oxo-dGTP pyrophosphatase MutT (NUDIX family)